MWFHPIFGNYRYAWLKTKVMRMGRLRQDTQELDDIFLRVLDTWNPHAPNIDLLYDALVARKTTYQFIPMDLICQCVLSAPPTSYAPWKLIHAMMERKINDTDIIDSTLRYNTSQFIIQELNHLVESIPPFGFITTEPDKLKFDILDSLQKDVSLLICIDNGPWRLLSYYMKCYSMLFSFVQLHSYHMDLTTKIHLNERTKRYMFLVNSSFPFNERALCLEFIQSHPKGTEFVF